MSPVPTLGCLPSESSEGCGGNDAIRGPCFHHFGGSQPSQVFEASLKRGVEFLCGMTKGWEIKKKVTEAQHNQRITTGAGVREEIGNNVRGTSGTGHFHTVITVIPAL